MKKNKVYKGVWGVKNIMNTTDPGQYQQEMGEETSQEMSNPWAPFFGELAPEFRGKNMMDFTGDRRGGISADQRFRHETYNLPEAYKGKSRHLEDVLDFMIREEDEFYTRDLMPWEYTDDIHVQWDVFKFNRTLADIEPEQGIPRLVTAQSEGQSASLVRRGLAFQLEHGFFTTERGKKHFMLNLQQITDAIHTTAYFGVIHALLTGKTFYKQWRKKYSPTPKRRGNVLLRARNTWAILQKDIKGLYILDARAKHDMGLQNVKPNVIVMPSKASMYAQMVPTSETDYSKRGPGAHDALASGNMNNTFRGSKVFEAEAFDVDFSDQNVDLLSRTKMIGEYFQCDHGETIQIFDADEDAFKTITYEQAAGHALNFNARAVNESFLETRKHSHFLKRDASDSDIDQVNQLRNNALWKPALEKAFKDALQPRVGLTSLQNYSTQTTAVQNRIRDVFTSTAGTGANLTSSNRFSRLCRSIAVRNLVGEGEPADGVANRNAARIRSIPGVVEPAAADSVVDLCNDAIADAFRNASTVVVNRFPTGAENAGVYTNPDNLGFQSQRYQDLRNAVTTQIAAFNPPGAAAAYNRQSVTNLTNALNNLHKFEDCLKIIHGIVSRVNYMAHKSVLIFRPFSTWRMGSAIIAQGGSELGSTFHGHHDFQLSDDVVRKTILGHYTFYSKAVVKRPKHYCIEEDVHCQGYVSGSGTQFFTHETLRNAIENQTIGTDQNRHDLIAWIVDNGEKHTKPIHMSGHLPESLADYDDGKEHFSGCHAMEQILGVMGALATGEDDSYMGGNNNLNYLCFRGAQKAVRAGGVTHVTHLNKGHWGELTYDGCMGVRTGEMVEKNAKAVLKIGDH